MPPDRSVRRRDRDGVAVAVAVAGGTRLMPAEFSPSLLEQYQALHHRAGLADLRHRTAIEIRGSDRAAFLNGFCTNHIASFDPGGGCEAFVTTAKGRVEAHVFVFCRPESLLLDTAPGQAERLLAHLDRYVIREDVQLRDATGDRCLWLVAGPRAAGVVESALGIAPPEEMYGQASFARDDRTGLVARVPLLRVPAFLVACPAVAATNLEGLWATAGLRPLDPAVIEAARVEAGFPEYGRDISTDNLPQEIGRDSQAISFRKGCYLGQETVARLDALGHVNRRLMGLKWHSPDAPDGPQDLVVGERNAGRVTTTVWSPRFQSPLSLAYLRRGLDQPGTRLETNWGQAKVIRFPPPA